MTNKANGHVARKQRQQEAALRREDRKQRSRREQIKTLDNRLGSGAGAKRERRRLKGGKR